MTHFHAGHNTPGYLPEADVETFATFADAKSYMIHELDETGDFLFESGEDERGLADEYSSAMEDLNLDNGPEWGVILPSSTSSHDLGTSFWINACDELDCERFYVTATDMGELASDLPYHDAVAVLNERCEELASQGWAIEYGWASSGNYAASKAVRGGREIFIAVEREES